MWRALLAAMAICLGCDQTHLVRTDQLDAEACQAPDAFECPAPDAFVCRSSDATVLQPDAVSYYCPPCYYAVDAGVPVVRWTRGAILEDDAGAPLIDGGYQYSDGGACQTNSSCDPETQCDQICEDNMPPNSWCQMLGLDWWNDNFVTIDRNMPPCAP